MPWTKVSERDIARSIFCNQILHGHKQVTLRFPYAICWENVKSFVL